MNLWLFYCKILFMNERVFDRVINKNIRIAGVDFKVVDIFFIICLMVFGWIIRIDLFPITSADYEGFLRPWMDEIRAGGGFPSLAKEISNYNSPYMYFMCLVSVITDYSFTGLKIVSYIFDFIASIGGLLVILSLTKNVRKAIITMGVILLSPAVLINSGYWVQCDIIYSCFIIYALYFLARDKGRACLICTGIAISFKLQGAFFLPFLVIMWLKNESVKFRYFVWIPIVYFLMEVPAWICGRPLIDLLSIYFDQADFYPWGSLNYPNLYYLIDETMDGWHHMDEFGSAGMMLTIALLGLLAYYIYTKKFKMTNEIKLMTALLTVHIVVYTLPHMHDRYGFLLDIIAIFLAVYNPKRIWLACSYMLISILSAMPYLTGQQVIKLKYVAIFSVAILVYIGYNLYKLIADASLETVENEQ